MSADLHVHTTASDGTQTPEEIVVLACERGLSGIALTDHDTTAGIDLARQAASGTGLEIIPGIELNTEWEDTEIHILGYFLDYQSTYLQGILDKMRQAREKRAKKMINKLTALDIVLSYEDLKKIAGKATICRPHIARAMIAAGYVSSIKEAFEKYIGLGKPAYVPRTRMDPFTAIAVIERAKGVPVLAHPGLANKDTLIPALVKKGLLGIEVYYPLHTPEMIDKYRWYSKRYCLVITGGTDYHGPGRDYPPLGSISVPMEDVERLRMLHSFID
jgi:predicted metal-dependent phosphoesterase TrpH